MLGSQIGPIVWTLVIRQVVRQPLPRVIPEEMYIGVSHCYGQTWTLIYGQSSYLLLRYTHDWPHSSIYSCRLVVLSLDSQDTDS